MAETGSGGVTTQEKGYPIRVSKLFYEVLEKQKKKVREVTYNSVEPNNIEATEILAKKIIAKRLV